MPRTTITLTQQQDDSFKLAKIKFRLKSVQELLIRGAELFIAQSPKTEAAAQMKSDIGDQPALDIEANIARAGEILRAGGMRATALQQCLDVLQPDRNEQHTIAINALLPNLSAFHRLAFGPVQTTHPLRKQTHS